MKLMLFAISIFIFFTSSCSSPARVDTNTASNPRTFEDTQTQSAGAKSPDYQWVQFGENSAIYARAIYKKSDQTCPNIDIVKNDGSSGSIQMNNRLGKTGQEMPTNFAKITVCEAILSDDLKSAKLGGKDVAIPKKNLQRVVVLGDTGCRDKNRNSQDCGPILKEPSESEKESSKANTNNSESVANSSQGDWNFKKTIQSAKGVDKTDFVIHVGDYVYRECLDEKECGQDRGRNWQTWETDFFEPAAPLLESKPWVFTRGNHEDCGREFRGWFLFFDPRPLADTAFSRCNPHTEGFTVKLNGLNLIVLDSSDEAGLNNQDINLVKQADAPTWLVTHVPLYGVSHYGNATPKSTATKDAITDTNIKFLVSGHIHFFEMIQFPASSKIPPQMVSGGGATKLDDYVSQAEFAKAVNEIGGDATQSELISNTFTFAYVDFESGNWKITVEDQDGKIEDRTFTIDN